TAVVQAAAVARVSGAGDLVVRAKFNVLRRGSSGLAIGGEARVPTGDSLDLLGSGKTVIVPRVIGSFERDGLGVHGNFGYAMRGVTNEYDFGGAVTAVASS